MPFRSIKIERLDRMTGHRTVKAVTEERPSEDATLSILARFYRIPAMRVFEDLIKGITLRTSVAVYRRIV